MVRWLVSLQPPHGPGIHALSSFEASTRFLLALAAHEMFIHGEEKPVDETIFDSLPRY
jgi:hypothetical protein